MVESDTSPPGESVEATRARSADDFVRSHFRRVYQFCRSLLGNDADAEDACQTVFLTVSRKRDELAGVEQPVPWLLQIARLTCLNARRERDRKRAAPLGAAPLEADDPGELPPPVGAGEDLDRIRAAAERLPERYRAVLALHFQQGLSHEEMAKVLGLSRGALRVLLHRAVAGLRREVTGS
jgi:RNA polymerase sigma-70 factor (ECF subfamily)